jgi:hypothetical protein
MPVPLFPVCALLQVVVHLPPHLLTEQDALLRELAPLHIMHVRFVCF